MRYTREDAIKAAVNLVRKAEETKFPDLATNMADLKAALRYYQTWRTTDFAEKDAERVFASASLLLSVAGTMYPRVERIPEAVRDELSRLGRVMVNANLMVFPQRKA
jgi:hypothetical protein